MKFAAGLREAMQPEWEEFYVNYKGMKKYLSRCYQDLVLGNFPEHLVAISINELGTKIDEGSDNSEELDAGVEKTLHALEAKIAQKHAMKNKGVSEDAEHKEPAHKIPFVHGDLEGSSSLGSRVSGSNLEAKRSQKSDWSDDVHHDSDERATEAMFNRKPPEEPLKDSIKLPDLESSDSEKQQQQKQQPHGKGKGKNKEKPSNSKPETVEFELGQLPHAVEDQSKIQIVVNGEPNPNQNQNLNLSKKQKQKLKQEQKQKEQKEQQEQTSPMIPHTSLTSPGVGSVVVSDVDAVVIEKKNHPKGSEAHHHSPHSPKPKPLRSGDDDDDDGGDKLRAIASLSDVQVLSLGDVEELETGYSRAAVTMTSPLVDFGGEASSAMLQTLPNILKAAEARALTQHPENDQNNLQQARQTRDMLISYMTPDNQKRARRYLKEVHQNFENLLMAAITKSITFAEMQLNKIRKEVNAVSIEIELTRRGNGLGNEIILRAGRIVSHEFILLNNFVILCRTAARKIMKKFRKIFGINPTNLLSTTEHGRRLQDIVVDIELEHVRLEKCVAEFMFSGVHRDAVVALTGATRTPMTEAKRYTGLGLSIASFCILLFNLIFYERSYLVNLHSIALVVLQSLAAIAFMLFGLAFAFYVFRHFKVSQRLVLGIVPGVEFIHTYEMAIVAFFTASVVLAGLNFHILYSTPHWHLITLGVLCAAMFNPTKYFFYSTRMYVIKHFVHTALAPLYPVEFADVFFADMLTSVGAIFTLVRYSMCNEEQRCTAGSGLNPLFIVLACLPAYWRGMQCLRRFWDAPKKTIHPHLVNFLKYIFGIMTVLIPSLYWNKPKSPQVQKLLILLYTAATLLSIFWDIKMDFGLFQRGGPIFLRPKRVYPTWVYYVALLQNAMIRCLWILPFLHAVPRYWALVIVLLEVYRRTCWTMIRIEVEHLENVRLHRVVPNISLSQDVSITSFTKA